MYSVGLKVLTLSPLRLIADEAEEFKHRVGAEVGRQAGSDIKLRVDLDEVEADDVRVLADRLQRIAQLSVAHAVGFG